jgi:hypothetical protein
VLVAVVDHLKGGRRQYGHQPGLDFCGNLAHIFSFAHRYRPGRQKDDRYFKPEPTSPQPVAWAGGNPRAAGLWLAGLCR